MIRIPVHSCPSPGIHGRKRARVIAWATVEDCDAALTGKFWTRFLGYPVYRPTGKAAVFMHREIMGAPPPGLETSHLNGDKMDNRRANLRFTTHIENSQNAADPQRRNNTTGIRGVYRDSRDLRRRWRGTVQVRGRSYATGRYATAPEAARALNALRARLGVSTDPRVPAGAA